MSSHTVHAHGADVTKISTDLAYMKRQIQELKNEIRKLGTVNVNAIEDFKNISERYAFLKNQHDDLVEAEADADADH